MQHPDALSEAETRDLRALAGALIPPSAEYRVPGADDDLIFATLLASLGRDTADVATALAALATLAGGPFAALPEPRRAEVAATFNATPSDATATLHRVLLLCYYRDDRVMRALDLEPRPPFPQGHTLEQGDWSLLDPVRARAKLWRDPG